MSDLIITLGFLASVLAITQIDMRTQRIPDALTITLTLLGLVGLLGSKDLAITAVHVVGGISAAACLWLIRAYYLRSRDVVALGLGDVKLVAALGLWVHPSHLPLLVLLASASALCVVGALAMRDGTWRSDQRIAFGPFLSIAGFAIWYVMERF